MWIAKTAALLMLSLSPAAAAQDRPYTPKPGAKERQAIVDSLRAPVEKELKQKVVFKIDRLRVQGDWAFLRGVPQQPGGAAVSYRGTAYEEAVGAGAFDDGIVALLRRRGGKWQVVKYVIGATDVPYVEWDKEYRAPSAIFEEQ